MTDEPLTADNDITEVDLSMKQAVAAHQLGRLDEAAQGYRNVLVAHPRDFDATHLLGVVALQQGRFDIAQSLINSALSINPTDAAAMGNLGTSYLRDGQLEPALQWFKLALQLEPDSYSALINAASALSNMGRSREAIPILRKACAANPDSFEANNFLGAALINTGDAREAVTLFDAATRAEPENAEGWANLSVALDSIGQYSRAHECADKATRLKPQSSTAFGALGAAQFNQGKLTEAIESYRKGVAAAAPTVPMLLAFGHALMASGLNEEAIEQLERAIKLDGNNLTVRWAIAIAHLKPVYKSVADLTASRHAFAKSVEEVAAWYADTKGVKQAYDAVGVSQPFYIAYQPFNNRALLKRYGEVCVDWMAEFAPSAPMLIESVRTRDQGSKLRIGLASAHIHEHSVWNAISKGWVHYFDRTLFDVYLFQLNPKSDHETVEAQRLVTQVIDQPTNLPAWIQAIKATNLDVLIYPDIGMDPLTVRLASLRLAPVQAASWGHPETTGLPTMDLYISADAFEPAAASENYSEQLVCLPNLGVYVEPLAPKITDIDLGKLNLPANEPLLLCPGSPFKYTPLYDQVWVQIASQLKKTLFRKSSGGRLVFFRSRSEAMDRMLENRLRGAFDEAGVPFDQHVSIIQTLDRAEFFALMRRSALLLDTLGFSGFNTAIQAIECDLPVLAFEAEFMRGRLASGIMRRLDIPELVATTVEEFVLKTVKFAGDAKARKQFRKLIQERRRILFHDEAPVRALERRLLDAVNLKRDASVL
jgi:protein O-GlcNAc transferase